MLRELANTRQIEGEPKRRWFFSDTLDLVVWFDEQDSPLGFQLAYDKFRGEHSIAWHRTRGYQHYVVDHGNPLAGSNNTPFLYANGAFKAQPVLADFEGQAKALPDTIRLFVAEKLHAYSPDTA